MLLPACLILDPIDIPEPEPFPPSVVPDGTVMDAPALDRVYELERTDPDISSLEFRFEVRDPNIDQKLRYQVWLNHPGGGSSSLDGFLEEGEVPASGEFERQFAFTINNLNLFPAGVCHKVEVRVSAAFQPLPTPREPVMEGDLGVGIWWIDSQMEGVGAPADTCNPPL